MQQLLLSRVLLGEQEKVYKEQKLLETLQDVKAELWQMLIQETFNRLNKPR
jgi:hypothetical protein